MSATCACQHDSQIALVSVRDMTPKQHTYAHIITNTYHEYTEWGLTYPQKQMVMVMALQRFLGAFWICFYQQADAQATAG